MNTLSILHFQRQLLVRLSTWSIASIFVGGLIALTTARGSFWQAFGGMNAAWGLVNLVIASAGLYGVWKKMHNTTLDEQRERNHLLRLLRLNAFLDVGYIVVGVGLLMWGSSALMHGFGLGIIMQGGFLLFFDYVHYLKGGQT